MAALTFRCNIIFSSPFKAFGRNVVKRGGRSFSNIESNYRIRNITEEDIPKIAQIRSESNLHDCTSSIYTFHKLDPEAIIVAEDNKGQIMGTHLMLHFAEGFYVSGLTYVQRSYRNKNLALEMIRSGTGRHRERKRLLVAYTFEEWAKNAKEILGFRMEMGLTAKRYISKENLEINLLSDNLPEDVSIHQFEDHHMRPMYDYDLKVAGYERQRFLNLSCNEPNTKTVVALKNRQCVGFGTVKLSCPGAKRVGPLYADDPKIAEALLKSLLQTFQEGTGVVMIVPSQNLEAQKLVNKLKIPLNDDLRHIYEKGFPRGDMNKAYAHFDVNGTSI